MDMAKIQAAQEKAAAAKAEYDAVMAQFNSSQMPDISMRDAARNALSIVRTGIDLEPGANTSEMKLMKTTIAGLIAMVSFFGVVLPPDKIEALVKLVEPLAAVLAIVLPAIFGFRVARKNAVDRLNAASRE